MLAAEGRDGCAARKCRDLPGIWGKRPTQRAVERLRSCCRPLSNGMRFDGGCRWMEVISRRAEERQSCQNQTNETMYIAPKTSTASHTTRLQGRVIRYNFDERNRSTHNRFVHSANATIKSLYPRNFCDLAALRRKRRFNFSRPSSKSGIVNTAELVNAGWPKVHWRRA